jgi:hypothetical protein
LPLTRPFVKVTLPGVTGSLISVSGRSSRDLWFISDEEFALKPQQSAMQQGVLIHSDGKRVLARTEPSCWGAAFTSIRVAKRGLLLQGNNPYVRGPSGEIGYLDERGKGECLHEWSSARVAPGSVWKLQCHSPERPTCVLGSAEGKSAALPFHHPSFGEAGTGTPLQMAAWEMRSESDGWMVLHGEEDTSYALYRYNGVTWIDVATIPEGEGVAMWLEDDDHPWIASSGPPRRFDGRALVPIAAPESFAATIIVGTGPRDVWFLGAGRRVYQWDGQRLHEGEAPFEVGDAWAEPGGEVWIVGKGEGGPGKGVTARTAKPEAHG